MVSPTGTHQPVDERGPREPNDKEDRFRRLQCQRLARYRRLRDDHGEEHAREELLAGYPERQRALMAPYLARPQLVEGFAQVLPVFADLGLNADYIDVSTGDCDAALEVLLTCMCRTAAADLGMADADSVLCELDLEATRRAFPEMSAEVVRQAAHGAPFCAFRYSRAAATHRTDARAGSPIERQAR
jgi:hypothetical protein